MTLFLSKIIENYDLNHNSSINITARDYYSKEQMEMLNKSISNLNVKAKVIPESTCALSFLIDEKKETSGKYLIANFKGTKCIQSTFEVTEKNGDNLIELLERKEIEVNSDFLIETEIYKFISNIARKYFTRKVAFLPYEPLSISSNEQNEALYCDISKLVSTVYNQISNNISVYNCPELYCYDKDGNNIEVAAGFDINLLELKKSLEPLLKCSVELPENTKGFIMTDYILGAEFFEKFEKMPEEALFNGVHSIFNEKLKISKDNIDETHNILTRDFFRIKEEMKTKTEARKIIFRSREWKSQDRESI